MRDSETREKKFCNYMVDIYEDISNNQKRKLKDKVANISQKYRRQGAKKKIKGCGNSNNNNKNGEIRKLDGDLQSKDHIH